VVLAREQGGPAPLLVAYVVTVDPFNEDRLGSHLRSYLPGYMIPSAFVPVSSIPFTRTGDVDEKALATQEVIEASLIRRFQDALAALPGIERVAVLAEPAADSIPPLHLADVIPGRRVIAQGLLDSSAPADAASTNSDRDFRGRSASQAVAFSDGGPLVIDRHAPATLTEALLKTAANRSDKGIVYVQSDGSVDLQTYPELLEEAKCILTGLRDAGLKAGDAAILQVRSLREHTAAFWACMLSGVAPVTVTIAPSYEEENAIVTKLFNTWKLLDSPRILASDAFVDSISGLDRFLPMSGVEVLSVNKLRMNTPSDVLHQPCPGDVAFFQLTSGSTGVPKCIQITHRGVICHIHGAKQFNRYGSDDVSLNWLPRDHVVPILTCHLKDVYLGCRQISAATDLVLSDPLKWLDLLEEYRVTHTWAPNFGFKLVADALSKAKKKKRDLSSVKFFMNAGEQVTLPVVRAFLESTAPFGVRTQAMQPSFGMAEACTCMTFASDFDYGSGVHRVRKSSLAGRLEMASQDEPLAVDFVDLGPPVPGIQIRIADAENRTLPEDVIGRFQIKGDVITPGYLNNDAANRDAFVGDGWFNSGDLGFIHNGRLTLTGRQKEIIIVNGANLYCYEIEDIVNQVQGVQPTYAAACGFSDPETGTEGLAIFFSPQAVEIDANIDLVKAIRAKVSRDLGVSPA
ncbi:MAG TPA: AMP-binding protein, partial [Blastocatellia bacterium]|nr:AMP-binding protein [Blastocatellia bacterium]